MRLTKKKPQKRPRIQFYLNEELDTLLTSNRALARKLSFRIDFQDAFRVWFQKENEEARKQLSMLLTKQEDHGRPQAH